MNVSEYTIKPGLLTEVKKIKSGGRMGQLYFLKNEQGEELVVKFQQLKRRHDKDRPAKAVIETAILERVGASAPKARRATAQDRSIILKAVEESGADKETKESFESDNNGYQFMVLMEFVKGDSIAELQKTPEGALKFLKFIEDGNFQAELGSILGADLFAGNSDRMFVHAGRDFNPNQRNTEGLVAFVNPGNLIVREELGSPPKPIAIDNQFGFEDPNLNMATREFIIKGAGFWGRRDLGASIPSLALAVGEFARQETGLLFEHFLDGAAKAGVGLEEIERVRSESKAKFQERVAQAANQALTSLLNGGGKWLRHYEFEPEQKSAFKQHKRLLRQLMAEEIEAVTPEMLETAVENTKYKQWVLKHEYKLDNEYVGNLLKEDPMEYKKFILRHKGKAGDDDYQQNLEKEQVRRGMRQWTNLRNKEQIEVRLKGLGQRVTNLKEKSNLHDSSGSNQTSAGVQRWVPLKKQPVIEAKKQHFIGAKKGN